LRRTRREADVELKEAAPPPHKKQRGTYKPKSERKQQEMEEKKKAKGVTARKKQTEILCKMHKNVKDKKNTLKTKAPKRAKAQKQYINVFGGM
jgi:hypothetical protein